MSLLPIANRQPADLTSWQLDESTEQFEREQIVRQAMEGKSTGAT